MKKLIVCLSVAGVMAACSVRADDAKAMAKTEKSKDSCSACCSGSCDGKMAKKSYMSPKGSQQVWVSMKRGGDKASS